MFLAAKKAEESEAALWRHRLASGTQSNADSIEIEVESAEMEYHLIKAVCTVTGSRERVLVYFTQNEMTAGIGAGEKIRLFQPNLQLPLSDASHYTVDSIIFCPEYIQRL